MNYFFLSPLNSKKVAVACAPENTPASYILASEVTAIHKMPFDLVLKDIAFGKDSIRFINNLENAKHLWFDYQPNSLAWPIMSSKLKDIICEYSPIQENLEWIPVNIIQDLSCSHEYYVLVFKNQAEVLNKDKSIFSGEKLDFLVKPVFSVELLSNLSIFCKPTTFPAITSAIYVNSEIVDAAKKAKLKGLNFEQISVR